MHGYGPEVLPIEDPFDCAKPIRKYRAKGFSVLGTSGPGWLARQLFYTTHEHHAKCLSMDPSQIWIWAQYPCSNSNTHAVRVATQHPSAHSHVTCRPFPDLDSSTCRGTESLLQYPDTEQGKH